MLRIVTEQHGDLYTISLHGRLAGEWVSLLDSYWRSVADTVATAKFVLTLSDVSFVDGEGERLLERMCRRGVEFVVTGCMNRHVIERVRQRAAGPTEGTGTDVPRRTPPGPVQPGLA